MIPLSSLGSESPLATNEYNRVYEAVSRGTEAQGKSLVQAIVDVQAAERRCDIANDDLRLFNTKFVICKCASPDMPGMLGAMCARCRGYIVQK